MDCINKIIDISSFFRSAKEYRLNLAQIMISKKIENPVGKRQNATKQQSRYLSDSFVSHDSISKSIVHEHCFKTKAFMFVCLLPANGSSIVRPRGFGFDSRFWPTFLLAISRLSPLMRLRKVVSGFEEKSSVNNGLRKPGNT